MPESLVERLGWRQYIGKEMAPRIGEPVLARDIRRYALAADDPNPRYRDQQSAATGKYRSLVAPLGYVYWATQNASIEKPARDLPEAGFAGLLAIPDIPGVWTLGWVRGADDYDFYKPVRVGDRVTADCKIADILEKDGRSGKLVLLITEFRYTNQDGELLATHRVTMIGRLRKGDHDG